MFINKLDNKHNKRWPATMFAVKRTDSVRGRIKLEISSISTIKFMRAAGVPKGTRWARENQKNLDQEKNIRPNHKLKENENLTDGWAEIVKTKGKIAKKLMTQINKKIPKTKIVKEKWPTPAEASISSIKYFFILLKINRKVQYLPQIKGKINKSKKTNNQSNIHKPTDGSNIEKILTIIEEKSLCDKSDFLR